MSSRRLIRIEISELPRVKILRWKLCRGSSCFSNLIA